MGQTLSEPVTEKNSDKGEGSQLLYGVSAMQGWRISMEDAHAVVLDLKVEEDHGKSPAAKEGDSKLSFFGVYDGHGGDKVALFAGENIHKIIAKQEAFRQGQLEQALKDGFLATDRAILSNPKYEDEVSGCTASVGIITKDKIYVANAGDSRTVLGVKGRAKPLSFDHKPQNEGERARITAAGGFVDFGRVNGNLALSRAIGDFEFKKNAGLPPEQQIVTAYPDVVTHEISDDDEFLVIACDGIWDCQSSQAVIQFVRRGIAAGQELYRICENMMDNCLASNSETGGVGCDNMTMIIVGLLRGRTKEEWYKEVAQRVANGDGPCAPPEYAEFRGPGVHHSFEDSGDDFDGENEPRPGRQRPGRIIMLGDSSDAMTDAPDAEIFDQADEDRDLASHEGKGQASESKDEDARLAQQAEGSASPGHQQTTPSDVSRAKSVEPAGDDGSQTPSTPGRHGLEPLDASSVPEKLFTPPKSGVTDQETAKALQSPDTSAEVNPQSQ